MRLLPSSENKILDGDKNELILDSDWRVKQLIDNFIRKLSR